MWRHGNENIKTPRKVNTFIYSFHPFALVSKILTEKISSNWICLYQFEMLIWISEAHIYTLGIISLQLLLAWLLIWTVFDQPGGLVVLLLYLFVQGVNHSSHVDLHKQGNDGDNDEKAENTSDIRSRQWIFNFPFFENIINLKNADHNFHTTMYYKNVFVGMCVITLWLSLIVAMSIRPMRMMTKTAKRITAMTIHTIRKAGLRTWAP